MTTFIGFMVLTERRIAAGRLDFCCCVRRASAATSNSNSPPSGIDGSAAPVAMVVARPLDPATGTPVAPLQISHSGKGLDNSGYPPTTPGGANGSGEEQMISDDDVKDENFVKKFFRKYCECMPTALGALADEVLLLAERERDS